ncbi:MAG: hypothetical protein NTV01_02730 [Bacteroidia bacterium]|nr:hypothetical protein [Bacteroidia bacterium]
MRKQILLSIMLIASICDVSGQNDDTTSSGTFVDTRDGNSYKWIKIGTQTWMSENLAYLPSVDSVSEASETEPRYYVGDYNGTVVDAAKETDNYTTYGVLYNWVAAKRACPKGWNLPTDAEWKILETYLGMSQEEADMYGMRGSKGDGIGRSLIFTAGWTNVGTGDNSSGFAALPGGERQTRNNVGEFHGIGSGTSFWLSSEHDPSTAWYRCLGFGDDNSVSRGGSYKWAGYSVRCLQTKGLTSRRYRNERSK